MTIEELTKGIIKDEIKIINTKAEQTITKEKSAIAKKLAKKFTYSRSKFKEISLEAFKSDHIQNVLSKWENDDSMELTVEANNVLENLKIRYPKILDWDNYKIINRLSEHWEIRKNIQEKITNDAINRLKAIDFHKREEDTEKVIKIDDNIIGNIDEKNEIIEGPPLEELNINSAGVKARSLPSTTDLSVLTSVFDHGSGKWMESRRAT